MSDASKVKRWSFDEVAEEHWSNRPANFYINGADHDRIMDERDELWKRATKFVMPGEMDTGESIEHYIKTLEATTARQAEVIEKLKGMVSHYETCATVDRYDDEEVPCDCGLEKELAAIEEK